MRYIYILLLCLIIYYIISRFYENYTENFDPSLVPVSSIVTLAKVAQKLVDGGGTLTSPGNLTLGTPGAVGNLLVTGTSTLTGNTNVGGTLGVTGASTLTGNTTVGGTLGVTGNSTITGNLTVNGSQASIKNLINLYSNTNKNTMIHANNDYARIANEGGESIIEFKQDKNVNIPNGLTVGGTANISNLKSSNINGSNINASGQLSGSNLQISGLNIGNGVYPESAKLSWGDGSGWALGFSGGTKIFDNGQFCIGKTCINESHLKMLTGAQPIALHYNKGNAASNNAASNRTYVGACEFTGCGGVNIQATDDINRRSSFFIVPN